MPIIKYYDGTKWVSVDANNAAKLNGKTSDDFAPASHVGASTEEDGSLSHPIATDDDAGFMSPEDRVKLELLRTEEVFISETRPVEPFLGMVWYKPSQKDWWMYIDNEFRYAGGGSMEARLGRMNANVIDMGIEVELLKQAELQGVNANIFLETLQDLGDIKLHKGTYDAVNKRITL